MSNWKFVEIMFLLWGVGLAAFFLGLVASLVSEMRWQHREKKRLRGIIESERLRKAKGTDANPKSINERST